MPCTVAGTSPPTLVLLRSRSDRGTLRNGSGTPGRGAALRATRPAVTLPTDLPVRAFPDQAALEEWLDAEHTTAPGLYVKLAKKGAGVPSVTYAELVESVLCFGWI